MTHFDRTMQSRNLRLSQYRKALKGAEALIGRDAADHRDRSASPTPDDDQPEEGTEPKCKTLLHFGDKVKGFNYESLPLNVANEAREAAAKIRQAGDNFQYCAGEFLTAIHSQLAHGHWLAWLQLELGFSAQAARNYMAYYEFARRHGLGVARLFLAHVVYRLASAPQPIQKQLIVRAETGKSITLLDVRRAHDAYRPRRPALQDSRDIQHQDTLARVGAGIEIDVGDVGADEELDEEINPSDDRWHMLAEKLITVLLHHPERWRFHVQMHALISDASLCQQVLARVAEGIAVFREPVPGGAGI
jgi:hypothetical protein